MSMLVKREFDISGHKVEAIAVFNDESGIYHFDFTFGGKSAGIFWHTNKTRYSREQAKRAAESDFSSGKVEAYAREQIPIWIQLGL